MSIALAKAYGGIAWFVCVQELLTVKLSRRGFLRMSLPAAAAATVWRIGSTALAQAESDLGGKRMTQPQENAAGRPEKALLFGGRPLKYLRESEITEDLTVAREKLGAQLEEVSVPELVERYNGLSASELEASRVLGKELVARASKPMPEQLANQAMEKTTRLYMAMRGILRERGAVAAAALCGQIRQATGAMSCVALTLLQDEGIPAACQGDIDALLTMMLFRRVSGLPSFMGGAWREKGLLTMCHCVLSRRMRGASQPPTPYYLGDYHGKSPGPTLHTDLPSGQVVTVARLTRNLENLILTRGAVMESLDVPGRCRNTLQIKVADLPALLRLVKGGQYHLVVACGDHADSLSTLAKQAKITVLSA
jgi:L-fucose isomerase-like protein